MGIPIVFSLILVLLHGPDGRVIMLNAQEIVSLHAAVHGQPNKQITAAVNCLINTSDGKFISAVETCAEVKKMIEEHEKK